MSASIFDFLRAVTDKENEVMLNNSYGEHLRQAFFMAQGYIQCLQEQNADLQTENRVIIKTALESRKPDTVAVHVPSEFFTNDGDGPAEAEDEKGDGKDGGGDREEGDDDDDLRCIRYPY